MKGVTTAAIMIIFGIVLAVAIMLFWGPMENKAGAWALDFIKELFGGYMPQSPDEELLINAMKCAYYRCTEGCSSGKVRGLVLSEGSSGDEVKCTDDFCKLDWRDSEGKICDDDAKAHPVEINLEYSVEVTQKFGSNALKTGVKSWPVKLIDKSCEPYDSSFIAIVLPENSENCKFTPPQLMSVVPSQLITRLSGSSDDYITNTDKGSKISLARSWEGNIPISCVIPAGKYYIWSGNVSKNDIEDIIICPSESEPLPPKCCDGSLTVNATDEDCKKNQILKEGVNGICFKIKDEENFFTNVYESGWFSCPYDYIVTQIKITGHTTNTRFFIDGNEGNIDEWLGSGFLGKAIEGEEIMDLTYADKVTRLQFIYSNEYSLGPTDDWVQVLSVTCSPPGGQGTDVADYLNCIAALTEYCTGKSSDEPINIADFNECADVFDPGSEPTSCGPIPT